MFIERLELKNFRNFSDLLIGFDPGTNVLYGKNAQGKTNILESVFTGCTSRSHKGAKDREMIQFGKEDAHIKLYLRKKEIPYRIDLHIRKNRSKGIAINGNPIRKASDLFGIASVVFFSPEDLWMIKMGPSERRRFMDMELCQLDRVYMHHLISYNKVIDQKNKLLKMMQEKEQKESDLLSVYNEQLCFYGEEIIRIREKFLQELGETVTEKHKDLTSDTEELQIRYEKNVEAGAFAGELLLNAEREIRNGLAIIGPHRDDFSFLVNGNDLRHFGSQGQQRTAALSLKLSEISMVEKKTGDPPVLLLDDVLSELDRSRQDMLLAAIQSTQTIITCTGIDDLLERRFHIHRMFLVDDAQVKEM